MAKFCAFTADPRHVGEACAICSPCGREECVRAVRTVEQLTDALGKSNSISIVSIPMRIPCPECHLLHIDDGEFATKPHHTHACQNCGAVWRPAIVNTVGVRFLPGFKNG